MAAQLDTSIGAIERPIGEFSPDIMARLHSKALDWRRLNERTDMKMRFRRLREAFTSQG